MARKRSAEVKEALRRIQGASPKAIAANPEKFAAYDALVKAALNPKAITAKEIKTIIKSNLLVQKFD